MDGIMDGKFVNHLGQVYLLTGSYDWTISSMKWLKTVLRLNYDLENFEWEWETVGELKAPRVEAVVLSVPQASIQNCSLPSSSFTFRGNTVMTLLLMQLVIFIG